MSQRPAIAAMLLLAALAGCVGDRSEPRSASAGRRAAGARYTVRSGDTLSAIAGRFAVDMRTLAGANGLAAPYIIRVGEVLVVPRPAARTSPARALVRQPPVQPPPRPMMARTATDLPSGSLPPRAPAASAAAPLGPRPGGAPRLVWPVDGPVSQPFPGGAGQDAGGVLVAAHEGAAVRSAAAGTVLYAGDEPTGEGRRVLVDHGHGWVTAYRRLGKLVVQPGEKVPAGARLGFVGAAGRALAPGLRFELHQGERAFDPLPLLPPRF